MKSPRSKPVLLGLALLSIAGFLSLNPYIARAQATFTAVGTLPATCVAGSTAVTINPYRYYYCSWTNTWTATGPLLKFIGGMQNNVFTDVLTFTVPNMNTGAIINVVLEGALGPGGSVGPYEAVTGRSVMIAIARVTNNPTVATIQIVQNVVDARLPGASAIVQTTQLSAISGLDTATQTFTLQYRLDKGTGGSNNHTATVNSLITSPNPTQITIQ